MASWRDAATQVIEDEVRVFLAERSLPLSALHSLTPAEKKELLARISAAYPFGPRENHPYKIWLSAVKQFRVHLGEELAPCPNEGLFALEIMR